jgi:hypothetical protein
VLLDVLREIDASGGDQQVIRRLMPIEGQALQDRERNIKPFLPGCA